MDKIEEVLSEILFIRTGIDFVKCCDKRDDLFWGKELKIPVRNIVCAIVDIENKLSIKFLDEDIEQGNLTTYNKLLAIIQKNSN